jgi:hypothetical protein
MNAPVQEFRVGDRVVCVDDNIDGSWEGEEGVVVTAEWNSGGMFAGPRWIYGIRWDTDAGRSDEELDTSDDFGIESA